MELYKPLVKWKAKGITILFLIAGLVMLGLGVYFGFVQGRGYVKSTGVIQSLRAEEGTDSEGRSRTDYYPTVKYTVDGKEYVRELGFSVDGMKIGDEVKIKYDPTDPNKVVEDSLGLKLYLLIAGAAVTVFAAFSLLRGKKKVKALQEEQPGRPLFETERRGGAERTLYFLTDLGSAKGGCHIEDAGRRKLYEAVCTKFSLISESDYDFIDHVMNRSTKHVIGKTATTSSNGFFVLDNHSTFDLDGRDIWKQLHENGVGIQTSLHGLFWHYVISWNGAEIARAQSCSKYVHEEDEAEHRILAKAPAQGFFRIQTGEQNLDVVFLTLMAISRTDMMIYK